MASDPLSVDNVLTLMAEALPTHEKDDTNSDLSSSYEAIALFAHSCMVAVGFRLLGFSENKKEEAEIQKIAPRLSSKWNSSFGSHSFVYRHSQSSMEFVIKIDRLGGKAEIRGIGLGDERISRFEITAKDYASSSALPLRISMTENGEEDRSNLKSKLKDIFISESRITDLASLFKVTIIQKLVPGLSKEGYEEMAPAHEASSAERERVRDAREEEHARRGQRVDPLRADPFPPPARPYPFHDPLAAPSPPRRPIGDFPPPGFEDEYEINRPPRGLPSGPLRSPFNIGADDLNPPGLGPNDPLRGSFIGGGGLPRPQGGGMHPTFDDPLFGGRDGQGEEYDPQAPPGSRYDPVGPGNGRPQGRGPRFPGGSGGMGSRPPNPFGGFGSDDFI